MGLLEQRLGYEQAPEKKKKNTVRTLYTTEQSTTDEYESQNDTYVHPQNTSEKISQSAPSQKINPAPDNDDDILSKLNRKNNKITEPEDDDFNQQILGQNLNAKREKPLNSPVTLGNSDEDEEDFFISSLNEARKEEEKVEKHRKRTKLFNIVMVCLCVYVIFLIYGVFCTKYQYDDKGEISPVVLSVSEIKALRDYNTMLVQYEDCRVLYEKILQLDYRLGLGVEDPMTLAPEYEKLLDEVNDLTVKTDALDVDMRYATIKTMLLNWVKTDTAVYLQKISSGISTNNGEDAAIAIEYKNTMYNDFSLITQNMIKVGDEINGANVNGIKEWSPEDYINEFINGENQLEQQQDGPNPDEP